MSSALIVVANHSLGLRTVTLQKREEGWGDLREERGNKYTFDGLARQHILSQLVPRLFFFTSSIYELFLTIRMKHINQEAQRLLSRVSCNIEIFLRGQGVPLCNSVDSNSTGLSQTVLTCVYSHNQLFSLFFNLTLLRWLIFWVSGFNDHNHWAVY